MKQIPLLFAGLLALASDAAEPSMVKPNIVVLLADDMRWDAMSCAGHLILKTPNLDRLAAGGTRFHNAFVTTSICCVSRASILTGQYARRHGVHDFKTPVENLDSVYPLNIDFAPTILELAGLPVPASMQGRSLLPLLGEPQQGWREDFFYEHLYEHGPKPPRHIEPCEGVRTRDWKYVVWIHQTGPAREELYDLRRDPLEMTNRVADSAAAAKLAELRRKHENLQEDLKWRTRQFMLAALKETKP